MWAGGGGAVVSGKSSPNSCQDHPLPRRLPAAPRKVVWSRGGGGWGVGVEHPEWEPRVEGCLGLQAAEPGAVCYLHGPRTTPG